MDQCVLGYTHHDMVNMFQSIAPGQAVALEVCRGYPLPFDPNDPNTEIVTTLAVAQQDHSSGGPGGSGGGPGGSGGGPGSGGGGPGSGGGGPGGRDLIGGKIPRPASVDLLMHRDDNRHLDTINNDLRYDGNHPAYSRIGLE